jgi:hypothetical protein
MEEFYLTIKQLRDFLNNCDLPDDTKIFTQRLEDMYVTKDNSWVVRKKGEQYHNAKKWNEFVDNYDNLTWEEQLEIKPDWKYTEEQLNELKNQYVKIWGICQYPEKDGLYLDVHY